MKKTIALLLALATFALCAGCGAKETQTDVSAAAAGGDQAAQTVAAADSKETTAPAAPVVSYDLDLTKMSSTMIYSQVSNIMQSPESFTGKTFRVKGTFKQNKGYYFVLINDATACCAQGLEFIWAGDHKFPDDYPAVDTEIIVGGTFESYMEGTNKYYHINNATLETA